MNKTAFLYPGQGSQTVGMGVSLISSFPEAADVFEQASSLAGYDMAALCSGGPVEKLSRTLYTQPALYTVEAAITGILLSGGTEPAAVAGHSLGEFSAWFAAGVYDFGDGFRLVSERARLMDSADPEGNGTMCAVIGLSAEVVADICSGIDGTVVVANYNSPLQQVISGEKKAVENAGMVLKEHGAKRVLPLNVSGAFHSPLMEKARDSFSESVDTAAVTDARIPVYANVTAAPVTSADQIRQLMVRQMTSPVRWTETVQAMIRDGIEEVYEIGPGNVLAGLIKRIDESLTVRSISDADSLRGIL
ncbi:ACP S-malonyltransferase [bacterium]|nr:ACP S-malonyltransferase [bacterium]